MKAKLGRIFILMIIIGIGLFFLFTVRDGHHWGGDFSMYIHHAKNIVEGAGYGNTGYIYNPHFPSNGPVAYPPLFPILLVPVYYFYGLNFVAMKMEIVVLYTIFLFIYYVFLKGTLPFKYQVLAILTFGLNPYFWDFKDHVLSEIPFICVSYVALLIIHESYVLYPNLRLPIKRGFIVSIFIYLVYATKFTGFVFIPCIIFYELINFRKVSRFAVVVTISFIVLAGMQTILLDIKGGAYLEQFEIDVNAVLYNFYGYPATLSLLWDNGYNMVIRAVVFIIITFFAFIGYFERQKKQFTIFEIYFLFYTGLVFAWPACQGTRYLIPIIPLYIFYAYYGIYMNSYMRQKQWSTPILLILSVILLVTYVARYSKMNYGPITKGIYKSETVQLFNFIRNNTDTQDVIIFFKPRVLTLLTGRKSAIFHLTKDKKDLWNFFRKIRATYIIVKPSDPPMLQPFHDPSFIDKNPGYFQIIYSNNDFAMYKIIQYADFMSK